MSRYKVKLFAEEDVKDFVNAASLCDFDIDISYNHIIIDAKSILGVLSMDRTNELTVICNGRNPSFEDVLQKYAVA